MRIFNSLLNRIIVVIFLLITLFLPSHIFAADESKVDDDIMEYVNNMQPGWNLGNSFDAVGTDETAWGNPRVTRDLIESIAKQGYKSIRIPITFDQRMGGAPDYTIDSNFLKRVTETVDWALEFDMYAMINIHHDSWIWIADGMVNNHDDTVKRFNAIWEQLADKFKDYPIELMFESINEPQFWDDEDEQFKYLKELNSSFFEIVRNSGGKNNIRPLVLPTLVTGSEQEKLEALYEEIIELNDPNLISTVHYYGFWPFSVNIAGYTHFEEDTKNDIVNTFDRVHEKFITNKIPVIIGEFGLLGFDSDINAVQQGEKLKFFEYMIHYAQEKQLTHMLWDNGQHFDRRSFKWYDPELYNMMKSSWETRSATAESDFIYLKKGEVINDMEMVLNLNGNRFSSLQLNGQDLIEGQNYDWDGKTLNVKASLLSDLTSSGELGKNAELIVKFNQGADWRIDVITYDTPTFDSVQGEKSSFSIPTQFNGDKLATMEAIYQDGNFAGPQNWTGFKEYAYTFSPLYDENKIVIKEAFFNEIEDSKEVNLTFHFWSGETLSYTVTKNGDQVTGVNEKNTKPINTSELKSLIETAKSISNENEKYTEKSYKSLQEAIFRAKSALETIDNEDGLQQELKFLQEAIDGLEVRQTSKPINTSELKSLIETAKSISNENEKYTEESYKSLQEAVFRAKSALETIDNEDGLQHEIKTLQKAIDGLEVRQTPKPINTSELKSLIETAKSISNENEKYTEKSYEALQVAIANAELALETLDTEEDLEKELIALQAAIDGLIGDQKDTDDYNTGETPEIDESNTSDNQNGAVLPNTATNMHTILLTGLILLMTGVISLFLFKKRRLPQ